MAKMAFEVLDTYAKLLTACSECLSSVVDVACRRGFLSKFQLLWILSVTSSHLGTASDCTSSVPSPTYQINPDWLVSR